MKVKNPNFKLLKRKKNKELGTDNFHFKHKSGAEIVLLKNKDPELFFAVEFIVLPKDKSGIPHILEHAVLYGSKKYPILISDPFVVLARRKQMLDLNAVTYPDKNIYFFSSINQSDFLSAMDIYLDAVFNPLVQSEQNLFRQEGWRVDKDASGKYFYNGVVLHEMLGRYGSLETNIWKHLTHSLFKDEHYVKADAGGWPADIVKLDHQKFKDFYKEHYGARNARIFLYGDINTNKTFDLIDPYLSQAKKGSFKKTTATLHNKKRRTVVYHPADPKDSVLVFTVYLEKLNKIQENLALTAIAQSISSLTSDALKEAVLTAKLASDAEYLLDFDFPTAFFTVILYGVKKEKLKDAELLLENTLKQIAKTGLNKDRLKNVLEKKIFELKKFKYSISKGDTIFNQIMHRWREQSVVDISLADELEKLLKLLESDPGYFDDLFKKYFLAKNKQVAQFVGKKDFDRFADFKKMQERLNSASQKQKKQFDREIQEFKEFKENATDNLHLITPTNLRKIKKDVNYPKHSVSRKRGVKLYFKHINDDFSNLSFVFDLSHLSLDELKRANVLAQTLFKLDATNRARDELDKELSCLAGDASLAFNILAKKSAKALPNVSFNLSFLDSKRDVAKDIFNAHVNELKLQGGVRRIQETLKELNARAKNTLISWHENPEIAFLEAKSAFSEYGFLQNELNGLPFFDFVKRELKLSQKQLLANYEQVYKKMFSKGNLKFALLAGQKENIDDFVELLPDANTKSASQEKWFSEAPFKDKALVLSALGNNSNAIAFKGQNYFIEQALARLLAYGFLWEEIRIKRGAYSAYFIADVAGLCGFTSFNDPNVHTSFELFARSLKETLQHATDDDIKGAIGAAIMKLDAPMSLQDELARALSYDLLGYSKNKLQKAKEEILNLDKKKLQKHLDKLFASLNKRSVKVSFVKDSKLAQKAGFENVRKLKL